jgi:hypothetical protein
MTQKSTIICVMKKGSRDPQSVASKVFSRIAGHARGWVFTPTHFKGLGSRTAVANALRRYKSDGTIRQLDRGLYDYPRHDPQLGVLSPPIDSIAAALQTRDAVRLQPSGGYAANILGLSTQVPMKVVFLTDGPARKIRIGKQEILLKHTTPRNMATAGRISGTVIQALRWLGSRHVDDTIVATLRRQLDDKAKAQIMKDIGYAPIWIAEIIRKIASQEAPPHE